MPASPTVNGNPFRTPLSFGITKPEWALNPIAARSDVTMTVGKLISVRADGSAVLADASEGIEANGVVVELLTSNRFWYSTKMSMWMTVPSGAESGLQRIYLGESGAISVTQSTDTPQDVGFTVQYRDTDTKHLVVMNIVPNADYASNVVENNSGGTITRGYIYGRNSAGELVLAQSGASYVRPIYAALKTVDDGEFLPMAMYGPRRIKAELDTTYTPGSFAWLSGTTAGTVTNAVPAVRRFMVGIFSEAERDGSGYIGVDLMINPQGNA